MSWTNRGTLLACLLILLGIVVARLALVQVPGDDPEQPHLSTRMSASTNSAPGNSTGHRRTQTTPVAFGKSSDSVQHLVSIESVDTPIREILKSFREEHGVDYWIDQATLGDQAALLDKTVTLSANAVTLAWVLDRILLPLQLDWLMDGETLRITTHAAAQQHFEARVYDVLDLIQSGFDEDRLVEIVEDCVEPESWANIKRVGLLTTREKAPEPNLAAADAKTKPAHKEPVKSDTHQESAKPLGRTHLHEGILIVWQTQRVHSQVEQLLDQLESLLDEAEEDRRFKESIVTVKLEQLKLGLRKKLRKRQPSIRH